MFKVKHPWWNDTFSKVVYLWKSVRSKNITQEHGGCKGKGDMAKAGMAVVITVTFSKKKKKKKFCVKPHFGKTSNNNNYTYKNIPFLNYYNGMFIPYWLWFKKKLKNY